MLFSLVLWKESSPPDFLLNLHITSNMYDIENGMLIRLTSALPVKILPHLF